MSRIQDSVTNQRKSTIKSRIQDSALPIQRYNILFYDMISKQTVRDNCQIGTHISDNSTLNNSVPKKSILVCSQAARARPEAHGIARAELGHDTHFFYGPSLGLVVIILLWAELGHYRPDQARPD